MAERTSTKTAALKKILLRHLVLPVKKGAEAEVDEAEQFRAVEGVAPGTFLFLKTAHLPEAVKQQAISDERGDHAERLSQPARAVSAQMISVAGKPQNKAESPRASLPSERSSSALGAESDICESMKEG